MYTEDIKKLNENNERMSDNYIIVKALTLGELQHQVNIKITKGYRPIGGLYLAFRNQIGIDMREGECICQAMFKE